MTDLLRLGASHLQNLQHALSTTGHNIANVNTEGFSRQTVNFAARDYQSYGFGSIGQGATISSVTRSADAFLTSQVRSFTSSESRYSTQSAYLSRLDDILANADNSLNASLQNFFNSVQEVAANPAGMPERQLLMSDAQNLVNRQQSMDSLYTQLNREVNSELKSVVSEINGLVNSIAAANREIVSAMSTASGSLPNDLLDQRDMMIRELSTKVSVTTSEQSDGAVNIFVGRGQALVVGTQVTQLQMLTSPYDSSQVEIGIEGQSVTSPISQFLDGGELQGLLDFRNNNLYPAQAQSGLIALTLTAAFNQQHHLGMDLNGEAGGDFFTPITAQVSEHTHNAGTAVPEVTITDAAQMTASAYRLDYDGTDWTLTRMRDKSSVTGAGPLSMDGMTLDFSGLAQAGDSFTLNPARDAAGAFGLALSSAADFAAASPVGLHTEAANAGSGTVQNLIVTDAAAMPLAAPLEIEFSADALGPGVPGLLVNGGADGTLAFDPASESGGKDFTLPASGLQFRFSGTPAEGDTFTISDNSGARGDNGNVLALAALQDQKLVNGNTDTFQEHFSALVANIGVSTRQADANATVEGSLLEQAVIYRDNVSGVNLDEEASNLLRYQQAYQAAAQIVKIADELFDILVNSIR